MNCENCLESFPESLGHDGIKLVQGGRGLGINGLKLFGELLGLVEGLAVGVDVEVTHGLEAEELTKLAKDDGLVGLDGLATRIISSGQLGLGSLNSLHAGLKLGDLTLDLFLEQGEQEEESSDGD